MALLPRGRLVFVLLAAVVAAIAVPAVTAAGEEWANESRHRGRAHTAPPAAAPAEPPSTAGLHASHGPAPAPGATSPHQGEEAPAPSPAAGEHSDGTAAAAPFAWPAALLAAAGVAAVMVV
ncbi:unnamed protein product [Urochloa decumbens]|uniref:Uncharacterized protein n=1 Tax=Urochloa decumbens TaxID=240449 RepID=A0ABC9GKH5_9POAL